MKGYHEARSMMLRVTCPVCLGVAVGGAGDGRVMTWGAGLEGRLGHGDYR